MSVAGTYSVIATTNTGHISLQATVVVLIQPPAPTIKSNTVVVGATLTLSLTGTYIAGATFIWTGPNGFSSALQNPSIPNVTREAVGIYTAKYVLNGVESLEATKYVYVRYSNSGCGTQTSFIYEGIMYNVVEIGTQCWMGENLRRKTTTATTTTTTTPTFRWTEMVAPSSIADSQRVCPVGWHIPSDAEFVSLGVTAVGDGNVLKAIGQGTGAGTGTGTQFNAIYTGTNTAASFWSISEFSTQAKIMKLPKDNNLILFDYRTKTDSCCAVRCIKD